MTQSGDGPEGDTRKNRRSARAFLIGAAHAAVLVPLLFYLRFGEVDAFALSFAAFMVVLCLLVALGYSMPGGAAVQTRAGEKAGAFGRLGSMWLAACAFGPFFGWLVTAAPALTEEDWRWRYAVRALLCVGLPVACALPLLRYVRGKYWHVALPLLLCVTALAAWSGLNTLLDLREGPSVRLTRGYYDAPHNSFRPSAEGRPFKLAVLPHTQRAVRIEPAPDEVKD